MATRRLTRRDTQAAMGVVHPSALVRKPNQPQPPDGHKLSDVRSLISAVLGNVQVSVTIPDNATLQQVEQSMSIVLSGVTLLGEAIERLKPIIGRHLVKIADSRLYRPDYKTLNDYIEKKVEGELKLARTTAFESMRIARAFPSMSVEDYAKYGASRLLEAAKVTDETKPNYKTILDESTRQTVSEFKERVKDLKGQPQLQSTTRVISLRLPNEVADKWESMLADLNLTAVDLLNELIDTYIEVHGEEVPEGEEVKTTH